jgi:hypothetical protein
MLKCEGFVKNSILCSSEPQILPLAIVLLKLLVKAF